MVNKSEDLMDAKDEYAHDSNFNKFNVIENTSDNLSEFILNSRSPSYNHIPGDTMNKRNEQLEKIVIKISHAKDGDDDAAG